jgi:hypothetical protein
MPGFCFHEWIADATAGGGMFKPIWMLAVLLLAAGSASAEPQRIDGPDASCDEFERTALPPCEPPPRREEGKVPIQTERDNVTVPPDIPAEGLPHQGKPAPDSKPDNPPKR